ncbi:hypothetical protein [Micromonospora sp. NPDC047074]|uniref:hypothetical protein n=1 Tax=Micromonospora sp. NPDC047074 TaxID=3154339 RepID=UPI00340B18A0
MPWSELRAGARDVVRWLLRRSEPPPPLGAAQRQQAAEQDEAKRQLLDLAEMDRIPVHDTTRAIPDGRWRRGR